MDKIEIKNSGTSVNYVDFMAIVNTNYIFLNKLSILYLNISEMGLTATPARADAVAGWLCRRRHLDPIRSLVLHLAASTTFRSFGATYAFGRPASIRPPPAIY
jgi:hypothetical protein